VPAGARWDKPLDEEDLVRVLIVGGGTAGCALAALLGRGVFVAPPA